MVNQDHRPPANRQKTDTDRGGDGEDPNIRWPLLAPHLYDTNQYHLWTKVWSEYKILMCRNYRSKQDILVLALHLLLLHFEMKRLGKKIILFQGVSKLGKITRFGKLPDKQRNQPVTILLSFGDLKIALWNWYVDISIRKFSLFLSIHYYSMKRNMHIFAMVF